MNLMNQFTGLCDERILNKVNLLNDLRICRDYMSKDGCGKAVKVIHNTHNNSTNVCFCTDEENRVKYHLRLLSPPFALVEKYSRSDEKKENQSMFNSCCYFLNFHSKVRLLRTEYVERSLLCISPLFSLLEDFLRNAMNVRLYLKFDNFQHTATTQDVNEHIYQNTAQSTKMSISYLLGIIKKLVQERLINTEYLTLLKEIADGMKDVRKRRNFITHDFVFQYPSDWKSLENANDLMELVELSLSFMNNVWIRKRIPHFFSLPRNRIDKQYENILKYENLSDEYFWRILKECEYENQKDIPDDFAKAQFHCSVCLNIIFRGSNVKKVDKSIIICFTETRGGFKLKKNIINSHQPGLKKKIHCDNCENPIGIRFDYIDRNESQEITNVRSEFSFKFCNRLGRFNLIIKKFENWENYVHSSYSETNNYTTITQRLIEREVDEQLLEEYTRCINDKSRFPFEFKYIKDFFEEMKPNTKEEKMKYIKQWIKNDAVWFIDRYMKRKEEFMRDHEDLKKMNKEKERLRLQKIKEEEKKKAKEKKEEERKKAKEIKEEERKKAKEIKEEERKKAKEIKEEERKKKSMAEIARKKYREKENEKKNKREKDGSEFKKGMKILEKEDRKLELPKIPPKHYEENLEGDRLEKKTDISKTIQEKKKYPRKKKKKKKGRVKKKKMGKKAKYSKKDDDDFLNKVVKENEEMKKNTKK